MTSNAGVDNLGDAKSNSNFDRVGAALFALMAGLSGCVLAGR